MTTAECLKSRDTTLSKTLSKLNLKNIGKEKLFLKFIYKNITENDYILDQEYWADCIDRTGEIKELFMDFSYFNGFLDGGQLELYIDDTIEDVILHDQLNETYSSLNSYFESVGNTEVFNDNEIICIRKNSGIIEIGFGGGRKCTEIFDLLEYYILGKQKYGGYKYESHSRGYGFEASQTTTSAENLNYQNHSICNEGVYNSQGSWFYTGGEGNSNGNGYLIGNPLEPNLQTYGFQDYVLDSGRVTDGVIKGPTCDCDSSITRYEDTLGNIESYKTFPDYQFLDINFKDEGITGLRDSTKTEAEGYVYGGSGVDIDVRF